jgi:uncharacterized membrane protein
VILVILSLTCSLSSVVYTLTRGADSVASALCALAGGGLALFFAIAGHVYHAIPVDVICIAIWILLFWHRWKKKRDRIKAGAGYKTRLIMARMVRRQAQEEA